MIWLVLGGVVLVVLGWWLGTGGVDPLKKPRVEIGWGTHTDAFVAKYGSQYPDFDQAAVDEYVENNRFKTFGFPIREEIKVSEERGQEVIARYLDNLAQGGQADLEAVEIEKIEQGFDNLLETGSEVELARIFDRVQNNELKLRNMTVPAEVIEIHRRIIGLNLALLESVELLLEVEYDNLGAVVGARQIEVVADEYLAVAQDLERLAVKYKI